MESAGVGISEISVSFCQDQSTPLGASYFYSNPITVVLNVHHGKEGEFSFLQAELLRLLSAPSGWVGPF
jgi:hypothetical protein